MTESGAKVDTIRLQNISYGHKAAAVLMAAVELDLFTRVAEGAGTIPQVAGAVGLSLLNAHRLVAACTGIGLLEKKDETYTNSPDADRFLVKGKKTYAGPWILMQKREFENWKNLADRLRSKEPPTVLGAYADYTYEMAKQLHEATYSVGLGAGMRFARDVDMSRRSLLLDLGGGSGAYCIAAVQKYPRLKAIVFDLPPVCRVAAEFISQWGLSDRIGTHPGDFTRDPFPPGADIMIQASNLPQYSGERLTQVFTKGFEALQPGGQYHLVGEALDDKRGGPMGPALWGMAEALYNSEGRAHSEGEVRGYLEQAGFVEVEIHPFIAGSLSRIVGRKPL